MRAFVTVEPEAEGGGLYWPIRGELVSTADGSTLLVAPLGSRYRSAGAGELADEAQARRAWWKYRSQKPDDKVREVRINPKGKATTLGEISHVLYDRWNGRSYVHKFKTPRPYLLEYSNGQLWIEGGRYRVGPAGIVG